MGDHTTFHMARLSRTVSVLIALLGSATAYLNVNGTELQKCSGPGMALAGFTRTGNCVDQNDDAGSHHICIDMRSNTGGNFCSVTDSQTGALHLWPATEMQASSAKFNIGAC